MKNLISKFDALPDWKRVASILPLLLVLFWFWFPRHWRLMQRIGAVIETHQTPTTNE